MELRKPFNALQHYLSDPNGTAALQPTVPLVLPPNTPPPIAQQVWQGVAQQAMQNLLNRAVEVEYSVVNAILESTRIASEFRSTGKLSAFRNANGQIQISGTDTVSNWKVVDSAPAPDNGPAEQPL